MIVTPLTAQAMRLVSVTQPSSPCQIIVRCGLYEVG